MRKTIEEKQLIEQKQTNWILWLNTVFTILAGVGSIVLPILQWYWHRGG